MKTPLKSQIQAIFILATVPIVLSSCGTIIGGSNYYARVTVENHPKASISYDGSIKGSGYASFKVPRSDANSFTFTIKEENCEAQNFSFTKRRFRPWAFVGTVCLWTGAYNGILIPYGLAIDLATGALWKPDVTERGVTKTDYKNYNYTIDYTGCNQPETKKSNVIRPKSKIDKLIELNDLLNKNTITQEEFEKEKKKILEE
jgi:hypothetical protein